MSKTLIGRAASQGTAEGTARIILSEKEFSKFQAGDILVTKQTSPAWTPLFAVAKAVVTELGGILSHAAIVAREYGIPAVVGVKNATKEIEDGSRLEVSGNEGKVEII